MKKFKYLISPLLLVILFTFCNTKNKTEISDTAKQEILYKIDMLNRSDRDENTSVNWTAYKTNSKTPVSGSFKDFSSDRENQSFNSVEDLLNGLNFSISSLSSSSGSDLRDSNINDYFFKYLTDNYKINGTLKKLNNDSIDVLFDVFGEEKIISFSYSKHVIPSCPYGDQLIEIKGQINLVNQFNKTAFDSIHNKCYDLHKGDDGISKTWEEVDVHIKALLINQNNPYFE